tara:strand:+ start:444 stop:686 length:243 start_codon:yes stop_codon:yes gene_type:complete
MKGTYGSMVEAMEQEAMLRQLVRDTRVGLHLTAAEVASRMGLSRPFYTQLEGGTRRMSMYYFLAACSAMRMKPADVMEGL